MMTQYTIEEPLGPRKETAYLGDAKKWAPNVGSFFGPENETAHYYLYYTWPQKWGQKTAPPKRPKKV
jgi:hypothetical protein